MDSYKGGSPRATIALVRLARAAAWLDGRDYVLPEDVAEQFPAVMRHRVKRSQEARMEAVEKDEILDEILKAIRKPSIGRRR